MEQGPISQGDNAKAKLVILKDLDLESLLKTRTIQSNSKLVKHVDFLELLRVSILQCNCLSSLNKELLELGQNSTKPFLYWLSILLTTIGLETWSQIAGNTARNIMSEKAMKIGQVCH